MAGAGKSAIGRALAQRMQRQFIDTDAEIEAREGQTLQAIVDAQGYMALRDIEQSVLQALNPQHAVIATGGSAVYSESGMQALQNIGSIVFLDADLSVLKQRVGDFSQRGLAKRPEQSFDDVFAERLPLYQRYADITVKVGRSDVKRVVDQVILSLQRSASA
ncbi:shikimate kinase [bacterium]|nr:shikimate kinase [bacterium]